MKSHGTGKTPLRIHWDVDLAQQLWDASAEYVAEWLD
jgi:hypothetical protein